MFGLFRKKVDPNKARNDKVRAALAQYGDSGTVPRHVMHFAYPASGGAQNATVVQDYLAMQGLSVSPSGQGDGFVAEETCEVASDAFDARTATFDHALRQWNWEYDGWECAVIDNDQTKDG